MCVKICYANEEVSYDMNKSLAEQLEGSTQVVVGYDPQDPSVERFFSEMERFCETGISCDVNIKVTSNGHIAGARSKRRALQVEEDLGVNDLIKMLVSSHAEMDKKLAALASYCLKGEDV